MPNGQAVIDVRMCDGPVKYDQPEVFPSQAGAECVFLGRTRGEHHPDHGGLLGLTYEAYQPMALREMKRLAEEAAARFGCLLVRMAHATGRIDPGQASVLIQVATPHRAEAFDACRFLIDGLKSSLPIWKREEWDDGRTWVEGNPVGGMEPDQ